MAADVDSKGALPGFRTGLKCRKPEVRDLRYISDGTRLMVPGSPCSKTRAGRADYGCEGDARRWRKRQVRHGK